MKRLTLTFVVLAACPFAGTSADPKGPPPNPAIDMEGFLNVSREAAKHRETRRLAEADFIKMSQEAGTIVLDARSKEKYDLLHIKVAINLSFPDIAVESLAKTFPDKSARILIYCNNNFRNSEEAFATKAPRASLNLSTYIALYSYGYRNIYELAPQIDPKDSKLPFESAKKP
jgi:rhodanese-related sulfurtransferase